VYLVYTLFSVFLELEVEVSTFTTWKDMLFGISLPLLVSKVVKTGVTPKSDVCLQWKGWDLTK
jgi:hypothetical protein